MEEKEAANSWKEMFLKALSSLQGLEKEIAHKDGEIQILKKRIKISEIDRAIRPPSEPSESILTEMKDLKSKLNVTEARLQEALKLIVKLEEERNLETEQQGILNSAFERLKAEVEAVLNSTEAFKVEAFNSLQALTADMRRYQAESDQKLQSLKLNVKKMEDFQNVHAGVLRTVASEQEILRLICNARSVMQQSSAASMQHLAKMENFCGKTIQKALELVDSGRTKMLSTGHEVPDRMLQLEGMATQHRSELSEAEKNLLESLASQTNLRSLSDEESNGANLEFDMPQVREKTPVKRHLISDIEASVSAGTSTQQIHTPPNLNHVLLKQSQEQSKRKLKISTQQTLRDVVARLSPLPFPTHQERTEGHHL